MSSPPTKPPGPPGRGAATNPPNRFERLHLVPDPDAAAADPEDDGTGPHPRTEFYEDASESILSRNDSPDVPYTWGLNPYRGCEHGCAYCFARPYHEYLGFSSGLDFETRIMVKRRAPALLREKLLSPAWRGESITLSGATDCYQPAERRFRVTRACLEVCAAFRQPVAIVTKNALVSRDADVLADLARDRAAKVLVTVTTLDTDLAGRLEPRASRPAARLRAISALTAAGVPVGVLVAPVIPGLTEHEIPDIVRAAADAGATFGGYLVLRLPYAVKDIFRDWLATHEPGKSTRVLDRVRAIRGGELNVSEWGARMKGEGIHAEQIRALFAAAARRHGLDRERPVLNSSAFRRPGEQLSLL
jgi:DNA repair photolyase